MTELRTFIRSEFQEHFDKLKIDLLWSALSKCELDFAGELLQNSKNNNWCNIWCNICTNPSKWAKNLLLKNPKRIRWLWLSQNPSEWAEELLKQNFK